MFQNFKKGSDTSPGAAKRLFVSREMRGARHHAPKAQELLRRGLSPAGPSLPVPELPPAPQPLLPCAHHTCICALTAAVTLKVQFTLCAHTALRPGHCLILPPHLPLSLATPSFVAFPENPVLAPASRLCSGCSLCPFPFPEFCQLTALVVQGSTQLSTSPESPFLTFQFKVYSDCIITILNLHKAFRSAPRNDFVACLFLLRQRPACLFTVCSRVRIVPGTE